MHRSVLTLAVAGLFMAACDSPPTAPQRAAAPSLAKAAPANPKEDRPDHQNTKSEFARTVMNPCLPVPEPVAVVGVSHYNAHFKFFEGGNDSRLMSNTEMSGVGLVTGVKYQYHEMWTLLGHYTYVDSRWETEQTTRFHVISQTDLGNYFSTVKTRIVYTTTGIEIYPISEETDCRG